MEKRFLKRMLCACLAAVMIVGMIPMSVIAMASEGINSYLASDIRGYSYSNDYWTDDYWTDDYWTDDPYWTDDLGVWTDVCWTDGDSGSYWTDGDVYARIKYVINDGEVKITDYAGNAQYVIIPSLIEGCPVTFIGDGAFYDSLFSKITLPDGLKTIASCGFENCYNLREIELPSSVTSIGIYAFCNCYSLESITLPESLSSISDYAFRGCSGLESIVVEEGNSVYHSDGNCLIKTATKTLVAGCKNSIIPDDGSVTSIGDFAFYRCSRLTSITIPDSVTSIGYRAFSSCSSLTSITIPESVTYIGECVFQECLSLASIFVEEGNSVYHSSGNCIIETATKTLVAGCKNSIIPDDGSVTSIGNSAFYWCESLTSITIPESVTSIGQQVFSGCTSLTSITIPEGVTSIGDYAFYWCISLTSITIPDSVTSIGDFAFYRCSRLTSITIPDSVTSIGDYAFSDCTSLTSITIPEGVTSIGNEAFAGCTNLTSITIPDSVTSIGNGAFYGCTSLTSITIPESVTSIGDDAFYWCTSLTSITIPEGVTSIGVEVFSGCYSLKSITIPEGVTSIGHGAFGCCFSLESITIPDSVTSIGEHAFYACSSLTSITIPEGVTSISYGAFTYCDSLESITIPEGVTSIGSAAFYSCESLTSITIPESVTSIGYDAFGACYNINTVYFTGSEEQWYSIYIEDYNQCLTNANIICCKHSNTTYYEGKDPVSCSEPGYTEGVFCNDCGNWLEGHTEITIPHADENGDNFCDSCGRSMSDILPGETKTVDIIANEITYLKFIPTVSGVYTFTSSYYYSDGDTYGYLYDADFDQITSNDDGGGNYNFKITFELYKGETYYWGARFYDRYRSGSFDVTLVCDESYCNHTNTTYHEATEGTCLEAGYTAGTYCNDCRTWIEGHETIVISHADVTHDGYCDACGERMSDIMPGETKSVTITANSITYLKFIPTYSGIYTFSSNTDSDTYGYLFNADKNEIVHNDDIGTDINFSITYELIAGETYYWGARYYSTSKSGTYNVTLECDESYCGHEYDSDGDGVCDACKSEIIPEGLEYSITNGEATVTGYTGSATQVIIPSIIEGCPVTGIGDRAFFNCFNLTGITIPDSVTSIDSYAFSECYSLESITVEEGNDVYHSNGNCIIETATKTLILGSISSVIPDDGSVTSIGYYAFAGCSIESISIPDSVVSIGDYAFASCSIESISIPDSVTSIGERAFSWCSRLETVYYGGTEEQWETIEIGTNNEYLINATIIFYPESPEGLRYSITNGEATVTGYTGRATELVIPAIIEGCPVTRIGKDAFYNCDSLVNVVIPNGVVSVGNQTFYSCDSLERITLPEGLTAISDYMFYSCDRLESITVPDSVTSIGEYAFCGCIKLTSITIPDKVTSIGAGAFSSCIRLTSITIPEGVTSMGESAFRYCSSLERVTFSKGLTSISDYAFNNCDSLTTVTVSESVTSIGYNAFSGCTSISTVYYGGTPQMWNSINIGLNNFYLTRGNIIFFKLKGDLDGDGELSASDALLMRQYLVGNIYLDSFFDPSLADMNDDGTVNPIDQLFLRIALAS